MIKQYIGQYEFLSNFYPCKIVYEGIEYPSVEHAFQASKSLSEKERLHIANLATPSQAKRAGKRVRLRPDWEEVKLSIMEELVRQKFVENEILKQKLLETADHILVEGNNWGDTFWGVSLSTGKGRNELGQIQMKIRAEIGPAIFTGSIIKVPTRI